MKGRKTAAIPGIVMAAVAIEDDCDFGKEVRNYLKRCGQIRGRKSMIIKIIKSETTEDDCEFGSNVRKHLIKHGLIVERDGKYEAGKS